MPDFNIDPSVLGKRAHARVFDQTVMICRRESNRLIHQNFKKYISEGRPEKFCAWLEDAYPDWQNREFTQYCMGIALKKERRYNEAKACFERILEMQIHPTKPKFVSVVMQELSQIFQSTGDYSTAWDYLDKALEVKPGLFLIYHNRLCLASIEHDEAKLFSVFMEMEEQLPDWYKNEHLTKLLKTDGELEYLRNSIPFLWNKINKEVRQ